MSAVWCGLEWTPWVPLKRGTILGTTPRRSGVYRIRHVGGQPERLVYIGQTGRALRERLLALVAGANAEECPFNDPHTAAPYLWLLQRLDGAHLECSCAPVAGDVQALRDTEDMLLWRHRIETNLSVEANYGRFYRGYARPTNRWIVRGGRSATQSPGRRATPLAAGAIRTDFTTSEPPLKAETGLLQASWWQRVRLSEARSLPLGPAVYCVYDCGAEEPVYVGETSALPARAAAHAGTSWPVREPWLAFMPLPAGTPKHILREFESDLLGWHFWRNGRAPEAQYKMQPSKPLQVVAKADT